MERNQHTNHRRTVHLSLITLAAAVFLVGAAQPLTANSAPVQATTAATAQATPILPDTPVCAVPLTASPALTEGPYYKANTPERTSLIETGVKGNKIILTGYVLTTDCKPVAHAWLDFWQADGAGAYDNQGYRLRGHQYTDEFGRYYLETVMPGEYPGRTVHIHVKVQAPNQSILTTQVFFPNVADNARDGIFDKSLVVSPLDPATGLVATAAPTQSAISDVTPVYTINFVLATK